jgi:CubicO group peptidase (beta-lactamase class C family)
MRKLGQRFAVIVVLGASLCLIDQSQTRSNLARATTTTSSRASSPRVLVSPEDAGFSSQRLDRIGATIQGNSDAGRIAGAVSLVARHGKIAYFKAFGVADREANKPMRTDHIFRICSMSKPIASVAVMILYEEGASH